MGTTTTTTTTTTATTHEAHRSIATDVDPNILAETHLHLVEHLVHQVADRFPRHVDRDDLRGAGAAGLVDAAHRYDPGTGVPFARYASIRVRGAILDATRTRDWATRRLRRDLRAIAAATSVLEDRLQRRPEDAEIADEMDLDVAGIRERRAAAMTATLLTLDRPVGDPMGDGTSLADRVEEQDEAWLPERALERAELIGTLRTALEHLPELPRRVLVEHQFEGRLLRDIAADLGVTEARASQLRHEALHALQAYFGTAFDGIPDVPQDAPGKRKRATYVARVTSASTWRSRLDDRTDPQGLPIEPSEARISA